MTQDLIRYDVIVQDALRGVVKKIVAEVVKAGLPGQHHFFISFDTQHPGVRMSTRLRARYPEEMTVVLQHQFWDLSVNDVAFEVGLSFSGIPERLYVPFNSIKGFFDPSVQFGLQFEPVRDEETAGETEDVTTEPQSSGGNVVQTLPQRASALRLAGLDDATKPADARAEPKASEAEVSPGKAAVQKKDADRTRPALKSVAADPSDTETTTGSTVVSIDSFRKKP